MNSSIRILPGFILLALIAGCSQTPNLVETWRPWTKHFGNSQLVSRGSSVKLEITSQASPFIGEQSRRAEALETKASRLLTGRGYKIVDEDAQYVVRIHHKTTDVERSSSYTALQNTNITASIVGASAGAGSKSNGYSALGVAIASLVGGAGTINRDQFQQSVDSYTNYIHIINIAVENSLGHVLWQSDAYWESSTVDIEDDWYLVLKHQLTELPRVDGERTHVPRLKEKAIPTYFNLYCRDRYFTSPGVPYRIEFSTWWSKVNNQEAYPAYVDLLQNAEIALPIGDDDYEDPTEPRLWNKLEIGGEYLFGPEKAPIKVLVTLTANSKGGYNVSRAEIATDIEYAEFQRNLDIWHRALERYYDLYE